MSSIVVISGNQEIVDDNNSTSVSYYPLDEWEYSTVGPRYGNSYHGTTGASASVNFTFDGTYVAFYADLNPDHGEFTVHLDGHAAGTGSSNSQSFIPSQKLFSTTVDPGPHVLTIVNSPAGTFLGVDYFVYQPRTVSAICSTTDGSHTPVYTPAQGPVVLPTRVGMPYTRVHLIVGLLCGLVLPLCCLVPSLFLLRTRKQLQYLRRELHRSLPATLDPDIQPFVPQHPPPYPSSTAAHRASVPGAHSGSFPHAKKAPRITQLSAT